MSVTPEDLSNCDLEPIHIPGRIQSHGFLIATDSSCIIRFLSTNTGAFIAHVYPSLLGKPLFDFERMLDLKGKPGFLTSLLLGAPGVTAFENINPVKIRIGLNYFNLVISFTEGYILLEFEPIGGLGGPDVPKMISRSLPKILGGKDLPSMLEYSATEVKNIIHYDRVMVYRFAPDGHGEVVAEAKNAALEPWLGLHYPASDIPHQARELYKLNVTRLIADVHTEPSAIVTPGGAAETLNLTYSQLRAVSPVHIQYLKNMGVASSFSISLLYKNELWGLIACHNYTPLFVDYESRESSKLVGQILSSALEFRQDEENQQVQEIFHNRVNDISRYLHSNIPLEDALTRQQTTMSDVTHASGAALFYDNKLTVLGNAPGNEEIKKLMVWISEEHQEGIYHTCALSAEYPAAEAYKKQAAGILVITLSKELNEYVIWFKEEMIQHVKWAGNPDKPVTLSENGLRNISPRHSFDTWIKTVSGTSQPWTSEEIKSVLRLKEEMLNAISVKASAIRVINERLRHAYEELDTFSYTISHDLKTPITAIKGYSQILAADKTISDAGKQILQRIGDRADKMNFMVKAVLDYSRIGRLPVHLHNINTADLIKEIIQDLHQVYNKTNLHITIGEMPLLLGDPVMIWQVFSNLISNAVKYSQHADPATVHIEGWHADRQVFYTVKDNGLGIADKDLDQIFLLFSRMDNARDIEGTGVGLAIVKKIVEKHSGIIWAESELGKGTTFFLSFNKD